jgi:pilus assembly protein Flp/PilA
MKMKSIKKFVNRFITDERGLAAVEYAVVAGLIAVGLITAFTAVGSAALGRLNSLITSLGGTAV